MRPQTEKHSDSIMRFFTPDLYVRFNSTDDAVADQANVDWEAALAKYQQHLAKLRERMPAQVRKVADLCLHDAEMLAVEQEIQSFFPIPESYWPGSIWHAAAILSLLQGEKIRTLVYLLWDSVRSYPAPNDWPFSRLGKHWLFDELDTAENHRPAFLHRILFSDGNILEIPFVSVIVTSIPQPTTKQTSAQKQSA
jgi:hypothetical protein